MNQIYQFNLLSGASNFVNTRGSSSSSPAKKGDYYGNREIPPESTGTQQKISSTSSHPIRQPSSFHRNRTFRILDTIVNELRNRDSFLKSSSKKKSGGTGSGNTTEGRVQGLTSQFRVSFRAQRAQQQRPASSAANPLITALVSQAAKPANDKNQRCCWATSTGLSTATTTAATATGTIIAPRKIGSGPPSLVVAITRQSPLQRNNNPPAVAPAQTTLSTPGAGAQFVILCTAAPLLPPPPPPSPASSSRNPLPLPAVSPATPTATTATRTSTTKATPIIRSSPALQAADAAGRDTVSMSAIFTSSGPGSTSSSTATSTATTTTATTDSSNDASPSSSTSPTPKSSPSSARRSAIQVAQRLSSWSQSTTGQSSPRPSSVHNTDNHNTTPNVSPSTTRADNARISSSPSPRRDNLSPHPEPTSTTSTSPSSSATQQQKTSFLRRLSPSLAARVKLLDGSSAKATPAPTRSRSAVGRIPQDHIKELDSLHQDLSIRVWKRGRAWSGSRHERQQPPEDTGQEQLTPSSHREVNGATDSSTSGHAAEAAVADNTCSVDVTSDRDEEAMSTVQTTVTGAGMSHGSGSDSPPEQTDLEKYLRKSTQSQTAAETTITSPDSDNPPPPPPKDSPPVGVQTPGSGNTESYFNPLGLTRTESIYSFSRASFSNQLSQLTSISLPQPASLEASIAAIPTASAAVRALTGAAEQIQKWINKASDVLAGLDAEDDVEWAAAGGREGLDDVDKAVTKFESLVNVYVKAIEDMQLRNDIADVGAEQLHGIVVQMESTIKNWTGVRSQLRGVKEQVELAMEWEELWGVVLGDVGMEMDNLSRLIFEMEEKRHKTMIIEADNEPSSGLDLKELETIVEESPANGHTPSNARFNLPFAASNSQLETPAKNSQDDSNLLALFARMQPLRASLDFLPMRLSMFQSRAERIFPSACEELEDRRKRLEKGYKKLGTDAEALRRELGEDRWILVFRNAGKQAQKMFESVERSVNKLQDAIDTGTHHSNPAGLVKKIESFEGKKKHYSPAIDRVLSIIQKGINDRLTVNGEIIRLLADLKARSESLQDRMAAMDALLEYINESRTQQQLRDSISSIVTLDSPATRSAIDTPESSPASSVVMSTSGGGASTPNVNGTNRKGSTTGSTVSRTSASKLKRYSGLPQPASGLSSRGPSATRSVSNSSHLTSPSPRLSATSPTPTTTPRSASRQTSIASSTTLNRPRWNGSANTNDLLVGHNFKPLSLTTPSPHRKIPVPTRTPGSSIPLRSPLSRESSASPAPRLRAASRLTSTSRLASASPGPDHRASPTPTRSSFLDPLPYGKLRKPSAPTLASPGPAAAGLSGVPPRTRQSFAGHMMTNSLHAGITSGKEESHNGVGRAARPGTALGHSSGGGGSTSSSANNNRRVSMLPQPKGRSGRESAAGSNLAERPPWRFG
ncbi:hypothetical protein AJ80_09654 [Polytolypa hystricis UAMH7299]|uniref:KAR9-domain-containing protein n=1 Tax=Polytolypa hystricis (strain UAMH7299) TaxID=1447883 RepID=A0A2B7WMF8_POLH7|nr:hypothetical protein AJ80_09654 [Polytolypa hystricis UAMH7299]